MTTWERGKKGNVLCEEGRVPLCHVMSCHLRYAFVICDMRYAIRAMNNAICDNGL